MGVVTDALPDDAADGGGHRVDVRASTATIRRDRDPFLNGFDTRGFNGDTKEIATGLTILNILVNIT